MKKLLLVLLTLATLLEACQKEPPARSAVNGSRDTASFSIAQIQQWFAAQQVSGVSLTTNSSGSAPSLQNITVSWDGARNYANKSAGYWLAETDGKPRLGKYGGGYRKIVFLKDEQGRLSARILEIVPDGLYLQRKKTPTTADFTGRLFVYDLSYHLLGGSVYSGGKVAGEIRPREQAAGNSAIHTDYVAPVAECEWVDANYIDADGGLVVYSERDCSFSETGSAPGGFDGGSGDYLGAPHDGSGGDAPADPPPVSNLPGEAGPAVDPKTFMTCFGNIPDAGAKMTITVYVVEPFPGTSFNIGPNSVGHTAIGLTKTNGSQSITQVVGFYPNATGLDKLHAPSKIVNNTNIDFDVSITYEVSATNFKLITNYISTPPEVYDLVNFNCTDFVYYACQEGGIKLPNPFTAFGIDAGGHGVLQGMSPAGLGQSIEKLKGQSNVNTNGGITPISKGPCN